MDKDNSNRNKFLDFDIRKVDLAKLANPLSQLIKEAASISTNKSTEGPVCHDHYKDAPRHEHYKDCGHEYEKSRD